MELQNNKDVGNIKTDQGVRAEGSRVRSFRI